eukprot:c8083_g1_i1.p1 GENE.c8083_g1_i1~~c8083_g1_i1.p1  ORF type:complete len:278 (-),score=90.96 c8083_g1_i1:120-953(-)
MYFNRTFLRISPCLSCRFSSSSASAPFVRTIEVGTKDSQNFRIFFENENQKKISPWHHIPLLPNQKLDFDSVFNFVCEIPKGTTAKMEIARSLEFNPIKQDLKKDGSLRHYLTGPISFNYGAFPQTWESPEKLHPISTNNSEGSCVGDNDPIDVFEISGEILQSGTITKVRPLGAFCLIDQGEIDWKIIAVQENHPLFDSIKDADGLMRNHPNIIREIREWLRSYKIPEGKGVNSFGFDEMFLPKNFVIDVINKANEDWNELRANDEIAIRNNIWLN